MLYNLYSFLQSCLESHELETQCSGYCYDVVKPLLHHTQVCYKQSEEKLVQEDREERFKQQIDSLQELVDKNNAFTLKFLANLEINMKEKIDTALQKQNQKIEQSFEQPIGMIHKIEELLTKSECTKCSSHNLDSVVKDIDKQLSNQGNTIEMALKSSAVLTSMLEVLGQKMDSLLSKQADQHEPESDPMWFKLGSKYYYISEDTRVNWHVASEICRRLGGYLVTFESKEEFNLVTDNLETTKYWTSFNDISEEGKFVSSYTGKAAPYLKWGSGEPTNSNSFVSEDCVRLQYKDNFIMNDVPCNYRANVICEKQS